jgi:2-hydroxyglutarate dehydrogenase
MAETDIAVVGGGILGLAVARELARRGAGRRVVVLEREDRLAAHQTGHNSGVAHAGIYYAPGSLKARLCVAGVRELAEYCDERGVTYDRCGKVIVALDESELPGLEELQRRGEANGVPGLRRLDAHELREIEPHAAGIAALHSPATAIVDFPGVAHALADDIRAAGGEIHCGAGVTGIEVRAGANGAGGRRVVLRHAGGAVEAGFAVFCAGAWSDRLARLAGADADPRIVPFRGAYLRLAPERAGLVRGLIYPVPDPTLPFLGVHLTRHAGGDVLIGPTALLAPARDAYALTAVRRRDLGETLRWPGTWRLARRFWRTGMTELRHAASAAALTRAAARYVPELRPEDTLPGWAGVRAQALGRDGRLVDDFVFSHTERALHVRNAPSPGATAALAIARHVADEAERHAA